MGKALLIFVACGGTAVLLGSISIWIGILSVPILYEIAESLSD